jgi:transcriptional antiterminator NusG
MMTAGGMSFTPYSGYENKVKQNLLHRIETMEMRDQIFNVIVPN